MYTVRFNGNVGIHRRGDEVKLSDAEYARVRRYVTVLEAPAPVAVEDEDNELIVGADGGYFKEESEDDVLHEEPSSEFDSDESDYSWGSDSDGGSED